jgi:hypothetical protein
LQPDARKVSSNKRAASRAASRGDEIKVQTFSAYFSAATESGRKVTQSGMRYTPQKQATWSIANVCTFARSGHETCTAQLERAGMSAQSRRWH